MNLLPITGDFVRALGWSILHAIWQAFFVYACLRVVLKLWPMASAKIKYNLSVFSLAGIFTWFIITFYQQLQAIAGARQLLVQYTPADLAAIAAAQPLQAPYPNQDQMVQLFPNLEICFPILVTMYMAGMLLMTIKLVSDMLQLHQIRTSMVQPMGEAWEKHLDKLVAQMRLPRKVKLLVSRYIQVPVMLGFLKPVILLPVAMVNNLSEEQLEAILLHELAHVKRNDYLLNIFQSIVETILFFNPFVWLISRIIRQEREHCCDDLVIAGTVQPLHYARALVALEEYRLTSNPLTMAAADNKQHLFHRIKRIMEMKTKHLNYSQKFLAVLIIATGLVSIAWLNPAKGKNHDAVTHSETTVADTSIKQPATATTPAIPAPAPTPEPAAAAAPSATGSKTTTVTVADQAEVQDNATDTNVNVNANVNTNISTDVLVFRDEPFVISSTPVVFPKNTMLLNFKMDMDSTPVRLSKRDSINIRMQVRAAQRNVEQAMKQLKAADLKRIQAEARAATESVDWKAIAAETKAAQEEATAALKSIDWEAINKGIKESYNNTAHFREDWKAAHEKGRKNWEENRELVEKRLKIAHEKMASLSKQRFALMRDSSMARTEALRKLDAEKAANGAEAARRNAERAKHDAERAFMNAEESRNNTKKYKELIGKMSDDKLIDSTQPFTIEKKNNDLYINGTKQPDDVANKYRSFLQNKRMTIKQTDVGNLNIDIEN